MDEKTRQENTPLDSRDLKDIAGGADYLDSETRRRLPRKPHRHLPPDLQRVAANQDILTDVKPLSDNDSESNVLR